MEKLDDFLRVSCTERVAPNEWIVSGLVLNAGEQGAVFRIGCEGRSFSGVAYTAPHRRCEQVALVLTR